MLVVGQVLMMMLEQHQMTLMPPLPLLLPPVAVVEQPVLVPMRAVVSMRLRDKIKTQINKFYINTIYRRNLINNLEGINNHKNKNSPDERHSTVLFALAVR